MPISEVYNIDCMEGMAKYPDKYFELAICDPPYGIGADKQSIKPILVKQKNGTTLKVKNTLKKIGIAQYQQINILMN